MRDIDLMKGDWVRNEFGEAQQVVEIRDNFIMLLYNDLYPCDDIEPIRISEEILKKNGFSKINGFYRKTVNEGYDSWMIEVSGLEMGFGYLDIEHTCDDIGQGGIDHLKIRYIHDLQHALTVCGLKGNKFLL